MNFRYWQSMKFIYELQNGALNL